MPKRVRPAPELAAWADEAVRGIGTRLKKARGTKATPEVLAWFEQASSQWLLDVEAGKYAPQLDVFLTLCRVLPADPVKMLTGDTTDSEFLSEMRALAQQIDEAAQPMVLGMLRAALNQVITPEPARLEIQTYAPTVTVDDTAVAEQEIAETMARQPEEVAETPQARPAPKTSRRSRRGA